jgi:predicted nucleic acid-binding protein
VKQKIIVDTNIVFSAILKPSGKIGKILINSKKNFQFYSCNFLRTELLKHRRKLLNLTNLSDDKLEEVELLLTENIIFINEGLLPVETIISTERILKGIDLNDTPFVALTKHLDAKLWTGDKVLIRGLDAKDFIHTLTTTQISDLLNSLET